MKKFLMAVTTMLLFLALITGIGAVLAFPVMWLVNGIFTSAVLLTVFGVDKIGFLQAWGLLILSGLLFKSASAPSK